MWVADTLFKFQKFLADVAGIFKIVESIEVDDSKMKMGIAS